MTGPNGKGDPEELLESLRREGDALLGAASAINRVLVAMVIRASREVEPRLRAGMLEELEALVPGSLEGLRKEERPEEIRRRLR